MSASNLGRPLWIEQNEQRKFPKELCGTSIVVGAKLEATTHAKHSRKNMEGYFAQQSSDTM